MSRRGGACAAASAAVARSWSTAARSSAAILSSAMRRAALDQRLGVGLGLGDDLLRLVLARARAAPRAPCRPTWPSSHIRPSAPRPPCAAPRPRRAGRGSARSCRRAPCRSRAGTFFQMMIAMTTSIASAIHAGAVKPETRRLGFSAPTATSVLGRRSAAQPWSSAFTAAPHPSGRLRCRSAARPSPASLRPRPLRSRRARRRARRGSCASAASTLRLILSAAALDLRLGFARARLLRLLGEPRRLGARGVHPRAPRGLRLVGLGARRLRALEILGDLLLARSTVAWIFGSIPRPMPKKMMPNTIASQNSCDAKISGSWVI